LRFVEAAHPAFCVVSTGGAFGREGVALEVLDRYERIGAEMLRTDLLGGITFTVRDARLVYVGARAKRGYGAWAKDGVLSSGHSMVK